MGQFISFKSKINNPWFNPWFILLHTHSNVFATVEGRCLEYLVCITLVWSKLWPRARPHGTQCSWVTGSMPIISFLKIPFFLMVDAKPGILPSQKLLTFNLFKYVTPLRLFFRTHTSYQMNSHTECHKVINVTHWYSIGF